MARLTNEEFVVNILNYSPYGALCQLFVLEAIRYYSELISKTQASDDPNNAINPIIWKNIAIDIHNKFLRNYDPNNTSVAKSEVIPNADYRTLLKKFILSSFNKVVIKEAISIIEKEKLIDKDHLIDNFSLFEGALLLEIYKECLNDSNKEI
jgi:hypothetical protein